MKKMISLLLTAIMLFCLLPMAVSQEAAAAAELVVSGGSYYYDGHEHMVAAEVKDGTGYTIQYSYYSVKDMIKATWTEDAPKITEPGSLMVSVRAIKGTDILTHDAVILEVVGNAPEGSTVKIIASGSVTKAPVYKSPDASSEKLGEFNAGDSCTLVSQQDKWFELTDGSTTGFVYYEFVSVTSRPNSGGGSGTPDLSLVEIVAHGGTYLYDGNVHKVQASLIHGDGFTLEFSVDNGKTWTTDAPGLTQPGKLTVKVHAISSVGIKEAPDVILQVISSLPSGTEVMIIKHGSTTKAPVRETPSNSGKKLGTVDAGKTVKFLATEGEWIKIAYGSLVGYVFHWFVDLENFEIRPSITSQPESTWVYENENVAFTVIVQGQGTITYQWQYQNKDETEWNNITGGTSSSYIFKATYADNLKKYRCIVTDANGTETSTPATLEVVNSVPKINTQPQNGGTVEGKKVRFTVLATGADNYQWLYLNKDGNWYNVDDATATTATLAVTLTKSNNGTKYKCRLTNKYGSTETNVVTLSTVKDPPKITTQPVKKTATEGSSVTFTVTATGDALTYQWQRKVKGGKWENCTGPTAKTASYTETSVTSELNSARYRCIVQNAKKKVTSKSVKLTVKALPPTITSQPSDWTGPAKTKATFKVSANGSGKLKYQWYYQKPGSTKWKKCSGSSAKKAEYTFKTSASKDGYKYRCVITNDGSPVTSAAATLHIS